MPSYLITPRANGFAVEEEIWFFDRHGERDWRLDHVVTFTTRDEAVAWIAQAERAVAA